MNEVMENMKTRRSVRAFVPDRMPARDLVEAVAEAGTYAPTGRGAQSPLIVVVTSKAVRDRLSELNAAVLGANTDPFYGAPVVLVVLADRSRPTYLYDGSLVMGRRPRPGAGQLLDTPRQGGVRQRRGQGPVARLGHRGRLRGHRPLRAGLCRRRRRQGRRPAQGRLCKVC